MKDLRACGCILALCLLGGVACVDNSSAPSGSTAETPICEADHDCPTGSSCIAVAFSTSPNPPVKRCNARACTVSSECGEGLTCVAGLCAGGPCSDSARCPEGLVCEMSPAGPGADIAPGSCTVGRIVSDALLARRWPDGVVPYNIDPGFLPGKIDQLQEALGNRDMPLNSDCGTGNCVGWDEDNAVRFEDCTTTSCSGEPYYANFISTEKKNKTERKRGFSGTSTFETVKNGEPCSTLASDDECRRLGGYPGLTTMRTQSGCSVSGDSNCRIVCEDSDTQDQQWCIERGASLEDPVPCDPRTGEQCVFDVWLRNSNSFMWNMAHEVGHLLGFNHEQPRYDRDLFLDYSACPEATQQSMLPHEFFIGPYDGWSVMHYEVPVFNASDKDDCWQPLPGADVRNHRGYFAPPPTPPAPNNTLPAADRQLNIPSTQDFERLRRLYGVNGDWRSGPLDDWCSNGETVHIGDFDKSPGADLYCHDYAGAEREMQIAAPDMYREDGIADQSDASSFCQVTSSVSERRVHTGDFDGDGLIDVLCHHTDSGRIEIDLSATGGGWGPADITHEAKLCNDPDQQLLIASFDTDPRADLACHDFGTGRLTIKLALGESTPFDGVTWGEDAAASWGQSKVFCKGESTDRYLVAGDYDGDGLDDLLCHTRSTGQREIRFSSGDGLLEAPGWLSIDGENAVEFCQGRGAQLYAVNADDLDGDDLLCHNSRVGSISLDLSGPSGRDAGADLLGEDWYHELSLCNAKSAQLLIGDVNGDGRDDLLCHNRATGHKAARFSTLAGRY